MLNNQAIDISLDDFKEYRKDLKKLAKYSKAVGGTISLPNFTIRTAESLIWHEKYLANRFCLERKNKRNVFDNTTLIVFYFNFNDDDEVFIVEDVKSINYDNQTAFIQCMKELETELAVRAEMRDQYQDSSKAFRELMEK